jgi:hypothetical protein
MIPNDKILTCFWPFRKRKLDHFYGFRTYFRITYFTPERAIYLIPEQAFSALPINIQIYLMLSEIALSESKL